MAHTPKDGLVLYKGRPARVKEPGDDRLTIQRADGGAVKVRPKDIILLHPGPCDPARLPDSVHDDLVIEADGVRELLASEQETVSLQDLAGLLFSDPPTSHHVWSCWLLLNDGLLFAGSVEKVAARSDEEVAAERLTRAETDRAAAAWTDFVERVRQGQCLPEDADQFRDVEALAEDRVSRSRLLRGLGRSESPENAHTLLLSIGWWDNTRIPHLRRHDLPRSSPDTPVPELPTEERRDLTHLAAFAIDDEGNTDPDDAVSLDTDGSLWVHVADVAALAPVDSPLDMEARGRGATLYLPTSPITMLPGALVGHLGLGLQARSPALSFRITIDEDGSITGVDVTPSWIQVERLTYSQADEILTAEDTGTSPLPAIHAMTQRLHARRMQAGALDLRWPEARIYVDIDAPDGPRIQIEPLQWLLSRDLVAEAMILAGEGAARYAAERDLPFPFSTQEAPDPEAVEKAQALQPGPAADFARRRCQRPGRVSGAPAPHSGLGVELYSRATSPLRRYLDLVAHQQLRSALGRGAPLDAATLVERVGAAEAVAGGVRGGESDARRHWTLLYLQQRPQWRGKGVLVDARGRRGSLLLPELALETSVPLPTGARPGDEFDIRVLNVDLPRQDLMLELQPR